MSEASSMAAAARMTSLFVPVDWVPLTPGVDALTHPIRAIRANGGGNVTVTTASGESRVMAFSDGETRMIAATHITAATASGLEGAV